MHDNTIPPKKTWQPKNANTDKMTPRRKTSKGMKQKLIPQQP